MDGVKVALRSWWAAHKFLFWALLAMVTRSFVVLLHIIHLHREAAREMLILKPRRPKDLYDSGYALFAYDITWDAWRGYWRTPEHTHGMAPAEVYEIAGNLWGNVPHHEVEFSEMPEVSFKVRAVSLAWCRENCAKPVNNVIPEAALPRAAAEEDGQPTVH